MDFVYLTMLLLVPYMRYQMKIIDQNAKDVQLLILTYTMVTELKRL